MKYSKRWFVCLSVGVLCVLSSSASDIDDDSMSYCESTGEDSDSDASVSSRKSRRTTLTLTLEEDNDYSVQPRKSYTLSSPITYAPSPLGRFTTAQGKFPLVCSCPSLPPLYEPSTKLILTIDGGGSRGIIPLFFLKELKRRLSAETGIQVEKLPIDIYAGTSVGALVAVAAAAGKIDVLNDNYRSIAEQIFSYSWWKWPFTKFFRGYSYTSKGREEIIQSFLKRNPEKNIKQELIIPFCSAKTHDVFTYMSYDKHPKFSLFDALMSTSAAPTYFPPHVFTGLDGTRYEGTDGGCFANHPGLIALAETRKRYPHSKIVMISLGTGHSRSDGASTDGRSLLRWVSTVPGLFMTLNSIATNAFLMETADVNRGHGSYFDYIRINPVLDREECTTDEASVGHLDQLETVARQHISYDGSGKDSFDRVVGILKERMLLKMNRQHSPIIEEMDEENSDTLNEEKDKD